MLALLLILIIIACCLLVVIILAQNPKGGGLSNIGAGASQFLGARQTADFLEKSTWTLAIALLALCLVAVPYSKGKTEDKESTESVTRKKAESAGNGSPAPVAAPISNPGGAPIPTAPAPTTPANK